MAKKLGWLLAALVACGWHGAGAQQLDLGRAGHYGAFILADASGMTLVEGRLAVGRDLRAGQLELGARAAPDPLAPATLVVGGSVLAYEGGAIWGDGGAVGHGVYAGALGVAGATLDLRQERGPVDFRAEGNWLTMLAASLSRTPDSGSVGSGAGATGDSLTLRGSLAAIEVFTVPAAQATRGHTVVLSNVRDDARVVINVIPNAQRQVVLGWNTDALRGRHGRVLYNLGATDVLSIDDTVVWGSVLAPSAWVRQSAGRIEGTVVAAAWDSPVAIGYAPFEPPPVPQAADGNQ